VLETFSLALSCDGRHVETGRGTNVLGSPVAALAHLMAVLAKQPGFAPLRAGELVTTGTITTARAVRAGETWRSEVEGAPLAGLTLTFSP
jgi:2-keto-4-pentenoate hydratase